MKNAILLLLLSATCFTACKRQVVPADDVELGKDYFPLSIGHYVEYDVDSFLYNDFQKSIDTFHFELKDVVESEFTDNSGRKSFIINRYKRQDATYPWKENLTYYATETPFNIEVVEDNLRFIKMVFPVKVNTKWDGNIYLPATLSTELKWLSGWEYKYVNINEPYNTGFLNFDNTVTINHVDFVVGDSLDVNNYSERTYSRERYAKNVGLISREVVYWDYQSETTKYRKGFVIIYRAKNHN
ncbi:MAG: hypothetical protein IT257_01370 [Chitinophagaceae bacterium]|nr:hypothetical protein [Chitinophagaceae bacterium]